MLKTGNFFEVIVHKWSSKAHISRISKDEYIVKETGEVRQYKNNKSGATNEKSLRRRLKEAMYKINTNCTIPENCMFITVTYRLNKDESGIYVPMRDTKKLYSDLDKLNKKFKTRFNEFRRITCCEPQKNGSWHAHIILIFNHKAPFIEHKNLEKMWGHGFVWIEQLDNVDNFGAYFTSILSDTLSNDKDGDKPKAKGERLHFYPKNFKPIRFSRNCYEPIKRYVTYAEAKSIIGDAKLTNSYSLEIKDGDYHDIVTHETFRRK